MVLPTLLKPTEDEPVDEADLRRLLNRSDVVLARAADAGVDVRPIGVTALDLTARAYPGDKTDWALMPIEADPTARDGLPMPRDVRRRLSRVAEAGLELDVLMIAHEVPKGSLPLGRPLTQSDLAKAVRVPEPAGVAAASAAIGRGIERTARTLGRVARGSAIAAGAVAAAPLALLSGLDPVVIGGRTLHGRIQAGEPVVWFELARWVW